MPVEMHNGPGQVTALLRAANGQNLSPTETLQLALLKGKDNFQEQLSVLAGKKAAENNGANRFNENGFFGKAAENGAHSGQTERPVTAENSNGGRNGRTAEETAKAQAEIAEAFRTLDIDTLREFLAARIGVPGGAAISGSSPSDSPKSDGRVQIAENVAMQSAPNMTSVKTAVAPSMVVETVSSLTNNAKSAVQKFADQVRAQVQIADLKQQVETRRSQTPVKLALRELDSGLRLVAEIKGLKKQDQDDVRSLILSLLAQHGLGNYDLWMNGSQFENRINQQGDA